MFRQEALFILAHAVEVLQNLFKEAWARCCASTALTRSWKRRAITRIGRGFPRGILSAAKWGGAGGLASERGLAYRFQVPQRAYLGYGLTKMPPKVRRRLSVEVHEKVFAWWLDVMHMRGVASTRLNAAMRTVLRWEYATCAG